MKTLKTVMMLGIGCVIAVTACNSASDNNQNNGDGQPSAVPPTNGEESRYNLNGTDTSVTPIDSNRTDTSTIQTP
ncbi:hypothetical protein [Sphingobacterium sp. SYP-B4668]|uniref:hypothetical protein n=1 Tax=Sphingobacterium sp. SYP-B4668 TaxID=2996035 RepID=UPI0022DD7866|nr:hypothetical protein [Sphingobacterium sp. SYP-B4668]